MPRTIVDEIMTRSPVTISARTPADEASRVMREHKLRHLVVVDEAGLLVGVLSDRDVRAASASDLTWSDHAKQELFLHAYRVEEVAHMRPLRVMTGTPIRDAVLLMRRTRVGCLPVTEHGRPVGIITGRDFLDLLLELLDARADAA